MDRDSKNFQNFFKSALDNDAEPLRPEVWNNIEQALDKGSLLNIKKKYNNLKKIVALLLIILLGFCVYEIAKKSADKEIGIAENTQTLKSAYQKVSLQNAYLNLKRSLNLNSKPIVPANIPDKKTNEPERSEQTFFNKKNDVYTYKLAPDNKKYENNLASLKYQNPIIDVPVKNVIEVHVNLIQPVRPVLFNTKEDVDRIKQQQKNRPLKKDTKHLFSITAFFSPDLGFYHLEDDDDHNQPENANTFTKKETHNFSSTTGALMNYKLNKRWSIEAGINYSSINISLDPKVIYAQPDFTGDVKYRLNTSSGYGFILPSFSNNPNVGDSIYVLTTTHNLRYIGFPLQVKYNFKSGRISFSAFAGSSMNVLVKGKVETLVQHGYDNEAEVINNLQGLKKIYFSGLAGIETEYELNKKMALICSPTIRVALNSINKGAPVKSYPNSCGLLMGIKYKL